MARLLAVAFFALVGTQSASAIVPTRKGMKDMAVNYWVRQVGPSDDISNVLAIKPTNISKITKEDMKDMAVNYWVRQVGPSDDITKVSKTVEEAAKPGKEDMKQMAANYWCAGRKFFETLEFAVTQFCARKKLAKRPHAPSVQVYCTRETLVCALSDDMLQHASLVNGVIEVVFPSAASVESAMGTFTEVYSGKRETFSFVIVWPCKLIFRPQVDGDRVHFVMTGIIKKNASGYVHWDTRECQS
eukprot:gene11593-13694_t